jgi:2-methylisocitrate lyase-like PEP mutase family enzyme
MTPNEILRDQALALRSRHVPGRPLVLPNTWDATSARLVEDAGVTAVATTSAGLAWALGAADGDRLDRDRALGAVARIADAVRVPVTADIESGYARDSAGVGDTIRAVIAAGAVGVNIEDALYEDDAPYGSGEGSLRPVAEQAERLAAARAAADAGQLCATVPETTVDPATTQKFATCSGLYTSIITGAGDLQQNLRPSQESAAG